MQKQLVVREEFCSGLGLPAKLLPCVYAKLHSICGFEGFYGEVASLGVHVCGRRRLHMPVWRKAKAFRMSWVAFGVSPSLLSWGGVCSVWCTWLLKVCAPPPLSPHDRPVRSCVLYGAHQSSLYFAMYFDFVWMS